MTYAQICALELVVVGDETFIEPVPFSRAEFFGVYTGVLGAFQFDSDHDTYEQAKQHALTLIEHGFANELLDHSCAQGD